MMNAILSIFVGCYTDAANTNGLLRLNLDAQSGKLTLVERIPADNPLYLTEDRSRHLLYANYGDGLAAFDLSGSQPLLKDRISLGGKAMCHLALSPDNKRLTYAAYSNGRAGFVELTSDGRFGKHTEYRHYGSGQNLPRQSAAHPHCAVFSPDGQHFAVCDLGLDAIFTYPDATPCPTQIPGAGPRHILYHPSGKLAFVVFELGDLIASYRTDPTGKLFEKLDVQLTTGKETREGTAAAIRFSPDGRCVIVSNRRAHSLAAFDFDAVSGKLIHKATTVLPGDWPRDFIFIDDTLSLVAMERTGEVHSLRYDPTTSRFEVIDTIGGMFRPVALVNAVLGSRK